MMFNIEVQIEGNGLDGFGNAPFRVIAKTQAVTASTLKPKYLRLVIAGPGKYPGSPKYPLRWKSARQRRYVMAKLRREGNLPYQRTGQFQDAWDFSLFGFDGGFEAIIGNTAKTDRGEPLATFIVGQHQQPFHADTGWPDANPQLDAIGQQLADDIVREFTAQFDAEWKP